MPRQPILRIDKEQLKYMQKTSRMVTARINQVDVLEKREDAEDSASLWKEESGVRHVIGD